MKTDDLISRDSLLEELGDRPLNWTDDDIEIQACSDWDMFHRLVVSQPSIDTRGNKMNELEMIVTLLNGVVDSYRRYDEAKRKKGHQPMTGYDIDNVDSKESIQRRITVIREELLKLSKSL